ncbi:MAG TPA: asparagine synthase (glutamine-hydrolyzing) [Chitinivibrionales bacterium]|nr:asparagine synthase (glutamine-hydrolyzing) [Chitinivibrionales bacterium]
MCSIFGIIDKKGLFDREAVLRMSGAMAHRGPDDRGVFSDKNFHMAHNRLSILDLSPAGHQPMVSQSGRYVLCLNGEIYNHREIRKEHLSSFAFRGTSDTETLLELCAALLPRNRDLGAVLDVLNGMFAFALWDKSGRTLYLARDRMGIKPLYVYKDDRVFCWASECKAFFSAGFDLSLSGRGLQNYFTYGHSVTPHTIFGNVRKVPAATWVAVGGDFSETSRRYWDPLNTRHAFTGKTYDDCKSQLAALINDAVRMQLISDVPLGAFLSGGVDSSALVSLIQKNHGAAVNTFSVGFGTGAPAHDAAAGGKYSELHEARHIAKRIGSIHHEIVPTAKDLIDLVEKLAWHYDEPFSDPAAFPTYIICTLARQYVTVCHSGEGADEIFGGYRRYSAHLWHHQHPFLSSLYVKGVGALSPLLPRVRRLRKIAEAFSERDEIRRYSRWLESLGDADFGALTGGPAAANSEYEEIFNSCRGDIGRGLLVADQRTWLADCYLEKLDKASMACGLEARVPYLDHRLVEFANSLPTPWKISGRTKRIFKDSARGLIPDFIIDKPKRGFSVPLDEWFRGELREYLAERLFDSGFSYEQYGLWRLPVEEFFAAHIAGKRDYSSFLWQMLMFIVWEQAVLQKRILIR